MDLKQHAYSDVTVNISGWLCSPSEKAQSARHPEMLVGRLGEDKRGDSGSSHSFKVQ